MFKLYGQDKLHFIYLCYVIGWTGGVFKFNTVKRNCAYAED